VGPPGFEPGTYAL